MPARTFLGYRRRVGVAIAAVALLASSLALPAKAVAQAQEIDWTGPCSYNGDLECGTLQVPLDYAKPSGAKITLHVERHKATQPADGHVSTIFVNPGGPGGGGNNFSASVANRLGPEVAARFDIVSFGPRGIGLSTPLQCFPDDEAVEANWGRVQDVPLSDGEMSDSLDAAQNHAAACKRRGRPLIEEMSTLNVARDLDELRKAVGDEQLHYAGYSYGTMLGATYANVFPDRVGRMILDAPVDPDARANHRVANKRARAEGFELALNGFLDACEQVGPQKCAFAAGEGTPAAKFVEIRERLRKGPVQVSPSEVVTISAVTNSIGGALYRRSSLRDAATGLEELYQVLFGEDEQTMSKQSRRLLQRPAVDPRRDQVPGAQPARGDAYSYTGFDGFFAVNCADARLPHSRKAYPRIALSYEQTASTFGRSEAFSEAACGWWLEVPDRYPGPWDEQTANPLLVVGQTDDPATPYSMALRMTAQLGDATLLTVDGFGHASQDSVCAQEHSATYMLSGELPAPGTRCGQDVGPFDPPPAN